MQSGKIHVSGETIEGPSPSDLFDVFTDDVGELVVILLDLRGVPESSEGFLGDVTGELRASLQMHEPLHSVINELALKLAAYPGVEAGTVILRMSQRDARVEILNAGMPPVARAGFGSIELHAPLSRPVGRHVGEVHAYEVTPLIWGSTWCVLSDGATGGSLEGVAVRDLCEKLTLTENGPSLADARREDLYDALHNAMSNARFARDDATCLFVAADAGGPDGRFQSGVEAR